MFYCFNFSANIRVFVKVLTETNVNISKELHFSDVKRKCKLHWGCKKSLYEPLWGSFTLHAAQYSLHFRSVNYIGSLAKFI